MDTITLTQSYSLVIRDIFFAAVADVPFFTSFTKRKSPQIQIQQQDIPYLGVYIVGERHVPDGDLNAGEIRFYHTLTIGFSVIILNNDPVKTELKLDQAYWAIMNRLWPDQYIMNMLDTMAYGYPALMNNPDNVRVEGISGGLRRNVWGDSKLSNELPLAEMQYEVQCVYRTNWPPVITDELDTIIVTSEFGDPPSSTLPVTSVYDFSATHPPLATQLTITSHKNPTVVTEPTVFIAVVSAIPEASSTITPKGTIGFRIDGGALQGVGPPHHTGSAAYPIVLTAGTHTVIAEFTPDTAEYVASVSPAIQQTVI
jgi:Bacterial Ig-like domain (group 3)